MIFLFKYLVTLIARTWRFKIIGQLPTSSAIVGFWHGRMLPGWYLFTSYQTTAVVSASKDGQILSEILKLWGLNLVRGSSSKGGKEVLDSITNSDIEEIILMTPDGPRGPRHELKPGLVVTSQRTQKDLYFLKIEISNYKLFEKAWDKFMFPLPFSKITVEVIGPIKVDKDLNREEISDLIVELNNRFMQS